MKKVSALSKEKQEQINELRKEYKTENDGYFLALQDETDISHQINELSNRLKTVRDRKKKHSLYARICDEKMRILINGKNLSYE